MLKRSIFLIVLILLIDQTLKFIVKLNMTIGQEIPIIGNWFIIHFTENEGMAFGLVIGGKYGKLFLSLFRILAIAAITYYLIWLIRQNKYHPGLIYCVSLILAGAIGNMLDSAFYGLIFSASSYHTTATLFPEGGGYGSFLHGKVVDMFYFPILRGEYPEWIPFLGGEEFIFFRPVFNVADSSITTGVLLLLIFQKKFFASAPVNPPDVTKSEEKAEAAPDDSNIATSDENHQ